MENRNPLNGHTRTVLLLTAAIVVVFAVVFTIWFVYYHNYESTDDAYVSGNIARVSSVIPGSCMAIYANDTAFVKQGQVLVDLDPTSYQMAYDQQLAALASTVLQVRQLYDNVHAAQANVEAKRVMLKQAHDAFQNRNGLTESLAVSKEEFTNAQTNYEIAQAALKEAETQLMIAKTAAGNTPFEQHPRLDAAKLSVKEAYFHLNKCRIRAPFTGYVAQRSVQVGQYVNPGSSLMSILSMDPLWIEANFLETQLRRVRVGQPVTVRVDMLGKHLKAEGKVAGISAGTGSLFSIIPPQNATGNWIKIVQRIPVRIALNQPEPRLLLGLSASVDVNVGDDHDATRLKDVVTDTPVASTDSLDVDWSIVDQAIDMVIRTSGMGTVHGSE